MNHSPYSRSAYMAVTCALLFLTSCSVSEKVNDSPSQKSMSMAPPAESPKVLERENKSYDLVQYRLNFMDEARLGGQDILFVQQAADLTSPQQTKLQAALQSGALPLRLRMRLYARNASKEPIQLKQLDYQLLLDGKEWVSGRTGTATEMEASSIVTLPVDIDLNVTPSLLKGSTPAAFAAGLTDFTGPNRRLNMVIRPSYESASGRVSQPMDDFTAVELVTKKR